MYNTTHTETDDCPLDSFEINTYSVTVPVQLSVFDSYEELELAIVETAARSIVSTVEHLGDDDVEYVTTQVDLNSETLEAIFADGADDVVNVETSTRLGLAPEQ
ncbi:hypothetical protein OB919_20100 [Halobacteria archaeon AArc-curdl1]|uniref:Uncharacterized protein n=1 Tax=Natronosalvus hydrolyticus TaxID=2979988 RepID=A0AAP3E9N8_9EURY|nr:hypothetical protein [Halobacteria archaeon AArc-curdl1]